MPTTTRKDATVEKTNPAEADKQTDQPGAPTNTGQTADVEVVAEGPKLPGVVTSAQATHSTGRNPDGGQPTADVAQAVTEGVAPQPVPAPATTLLSTPGGYQVVPAGVPQGDVGSNAISRG